MQVNGKGSFKEEIPGSKLSMYDYTDLLQTL